MSLNPDIIEGVRQVLAAEVGANAAETDAQIRLADLPGWSSLGFMRVLVALESKFQVEYEVEDLVGVVTVGDLCRFVEQKREQCKH
jgi:acyl carrier protein